MTDLSPFVLPATRSQPRVAILVDGDNIPPSSCPSLEVRAQSMGQIVVRRVYADMGLRKDWASTFGYDAFHCGSGAAKNHADIRLVIGAMDLAYRGLAQAFLILSDDRDFAPLVRHLREMGLTAEVVGKPKVAKLSLVDTALRSVLASADKGLLLQVLGTQMRAHPVKASTGKGTWRAYLTSKPELFCLTGSGQETRVTWCGGTC